MSIAEPGCSDLLTQLFVVDPEAEEAATLVPPPPPPRPPLLCTRSSVPCRDGQECVSREYLCDGKRDCEDGSDEENCSYFCNKPGVLSPILGLLSQVCWFQQAMNFQSFIFFITLAFPVNFHRLVTVCDCPFYHIKVRQYFARYNPLLLPCFLRLLKYSKPKSDLNGLFITDLGVF